MCVELIPKDLNLDSYSSHPTSTCVITTVHTRTCGITTAYRVHGGYVVTHFLINIFLI